MNPLLIAYAISFGIADRVWGGDVKHGRRWSILIALTAGLGLGFYRSQVDGLIFGGVVALAFLITRSLPFRGVFGTTTPRKGGQFIALVFRHAFLIVPAASYTAFRLWDDWRRPAISFGVWALLTGFLGLFHGAENAAAKKRGGPIQAWVNAFVESARGALFGVALGLAQ